MVALDWEIIYAYYFSHPLSYLGHALFWKSRQQPRISLSSESLGASSSSDHKFARVCRILGDDADMEKNTIVIKSASADAAADDIVTVFRKFKDFQLLRQQLTIEMSEASLPDITIQKEVSAYNSTSLVKKRLVKRLSKVEEGGRRD